MSKKYATQTIEGLEIGVRNRLKEALKYIIYINKANQHFNQEKSFADSSGEKNPHYCA